MLLEKSNLSNSLILYKICNDTLIQVKFDKIDHREYTYIINGRSGPTGKTWLTNSLVEKGYRAMDVSEATPHYSADKNNYIYIDKKSKVVLIVLNRELRRR